MCSRTTASRSAWEQSEALYDSSLFSHGECDLHDTSDAGPGASQVHSKACLNDVRDMSKGPGSLGLCHRGDVNNGRYLCGRNLSILMASHPLTMQL
jgi:hypothetical protein